MIAITYDKPAIQAEIRYLNEEQQQYPQAVQMYFDHYGLDWPDTEHRFGWFQSGGLKLAGHVWVPVGREFTTHKPVEMVILLHGYLDHTGQLKHLILALLEYGYVVGAFDLPGHGLSEGKAAAVGALSDYTTALEDFIQATRWVCPDKLHFVGFSNGASVGIDELLSKQGDQFDKVVLAGPLVQWTGYQPSKAMYLACSPFTDRIGRIMQTNSSDENFLSFNRNDDYLHCRDVSLDWIRALYDWNDRFAKLPVSSKEVLIIQGSYDMTVDWRYNLKALRKKFPAAKVEMIEGARHELFNESSALREESITKVVNYLQNTD
jgi:alpha-beta hydrolase superfamily lysophospholipase